MSKVFFQLSTGNFFQDWSDPSLIMADNDWSRVASIQGFNGGSTGTTGTNPQTVLSEPAGQTTQVFANRGSGTTLTSGGVAEFDGLVDPTIALQGSGSARAPSLVLYLDSSGRQGVTLEFDARDIDGTADNSAQQIAVQYRIGDSGAWTNLPAGYIADASTGPSLATLTTHISVTLPADCDNQSQLEIRIITTDAVGSDEWIGIDNISVTTTPVAAVHPGSLSIDDVAVTEGDTGTTEMVFTVTRSGGSDGAASASWSVVHGTTDAADFTGATSGTVTFAEGETRKTIAIQVAGDLAIEANESFTLQLGNPQGGVTITDGSGAGTIITNDLPPIANVWINEFHYDPSSVPETGEFIEVAGQAGIDLSGYKLVLYNGNGGGSYGTLSLSGSLGDTANGFGFAAVAAPGLQNGSPDGIALVDGFGRVVQFLSYEGTMTATNGPAAGMTSTDIIRFEDQATPGTSLQLAGTGSTYADFHWTFGNANTSGGSNAGQSFLSGTDEGEIRLDNAHVVESDSGEAMLVFTLHRSGGFATEASVNYTISFDTADAADLPEGTALTGSATFAVGELTQTISIPVAGDTLPEYNETLSVNLGAVTGNAVVVDAIGVGTILNNDPLPLTIMEIQGETHFSEFDGQPVITSGVVTAVTANGFYMQDPNGDGNANTSDGIFVFTSSAPAVAVGDAVNVTGRANEFGSDLPMTEVNVTETGFGVTVVSHGNALPDAVLVGVGGLMPPTESIDSDGLTIFNPETDGADFWESLEGMRVSIDAPQVVASSNAFGETYVVASHGVGATGLNDSGGMTITGTDSNPEMIQIDAALLASTGYASNLSIGDQLRTVTGIIDYSFSHYELLLTEAPATTVDVTLQPETVGFTGDANYMTVATFNVENLGPEDGRYDELADQIAHNLGSPDVIALQEMQDNDGTGRGTDLSASKNAQGLIDAIFAETGIVYAYAEIAPTAANTTGGEANGNIRSGYLYRVDRVSLVEGSLQTIQDPSYSNSREPLVATWSFQGQQITTINVHFYARSGGDPLWGANQPPEISGDDRRTDQAHAVGDWVNDHLADNPALNIAVLGDWNGFYWEEAQTQLTGLVNLQVEKLPEGERYSYFFDGNGQLFDNIVVTGGLVSSAMVDGVHINAYFGSAQTSDHDPQVAAFLLGTSPTNVLLDHASVAENEAAGAIVGTVSATDAPGDRLTYSLVDNSDGLFAIDASTGVVTTTAALDHEALASTGITVRVTDAAGQAADKAFTIAIGDVNEAPVAAADDAAVNEDATTANLWTQLLGNDRDPDAGDTLTITGVDTTGTLGHVMFDAATQTLRYAADDDSFDALAPGATATDSFTYTVTDAAGLSRIATVTMTITGIDDGIVINGKNGNESFTATAGEDQLFGNNGNDRLDGGDGHDLLDGGKGNDVLFGGTGNDTLTGGQGDDQLAGGSGRDTFVFGDSSGIDFILDFTALDHIRLEGSQSIMGSRNADVNGDGITDLVLTLNNRASVTLLGVTSIGTGQVETAALTGWHSSAFQSHVADPSGELTLRSEDHAWLI